MDPLRLELRNFLSYRDEAIDLSRINLAALVGANGAGKSSLLDAITFVLFGQSTKGSSRELDNHITRGETECAVALEFALGGRWYRVVRSRSIARNKSTLDFFLREGREWRPCGGKTLAETQAAIEAILRMDYRTFTASSLILQGQADAFTADMTDAERKEALARILGLDLWDRMLEETKGFIKTIETETGILDLQIKRLEGAPDPEKLAEEHEAKIGALAGLEERIIGAQAIISTLEGKLGQEAVLSSRLAAISGDLSRKTQELGAVTGEILRATQKTEGLRKEIESLESLLSMRAEVEAAALREAELAGRVEEMDRKAREHMRIASELQTLERQAADWERTRAAEKAKLEAQIKGGMEQAAVLDIVPCGGEQKATCPLLKLARRAAEMLDGARAKLAELESQSNPLAGSIAQAKADLAAVGYDSDTHARLRAALEEARKAARRKADLDAAEARIQALREMLTELDSNIPNLRARTEMISGEIKALEAERDEIQKQLAILIPARTELTEARMRLEALRQEEAAIRTELGRLEQQIAEALKARDELETAKTRQKELTDKLFIYRTLERACGRRGGVPALIIENAVPEIERLANDMLSRMAGGRLAVRLDTQAEAKSGTMQEVLRITVLDGGMERPYQTYSGAERFMVDLALRVALSKFLAHRAGAEIKLFVLDEGLGACDPANRQAVMEAIQAVAQEFGKVLVITHIVELQDALPQRIEVTKDQDGSHVRIAG